MVQVKKSARPLQVIATVVIALSWVLGCPALFCAPNRSLAQDVAGAGIDSEQEHESALREQIRSLLQQANELQAQGDATQALVLRNRAKSLFRSLQAMQESRSANENETSSRASRQPDRPTLTKADAVLALHRCIEVLKLLGESETARPVERVLNRIATPSEVRDIVNYYREQPAPNGRSANDNRSAPDHSAASGSTGNSKTRPGADNTPVDDPPSSRATDSDHSPARAAWLVETPEALENEIAALKIAMETLLENDRVEAGRVLAEGLVLRGRALRSGELTWDYSTPEFPAREIEAVRMAATLMFRDQNAIQARLLRDLAILLADRQRPRPMGNRAAEDDADSVTRLLQRIQELELENRRLKSRLDDNTPDEPGKNRQ